MAPRTAEEEALAGIWCDVLKVDRVGVRDNFFELGGHSLLMTQVISRFREVFKTELAIRRFFEAPTVEALAQSASLGQHDVARQPAFTSRRARQSKAEALLARLDELSDSEVDQLLQDPELKSDLP